MSTSLSRLTPRHCGNSRSGGLSSCCAPAIAIWVSKKAVAESSSAVLTGCKAPQEAAWHWPVLCTGWVKNACLPSSRSWKQAELFRLWMRLVVSRLNCSVACAKADSTCSQIAITGGQFSAPKGTWKEGFVSAHLWTKFLSLSTLAQIGVLLKRHSDTLH